MSEIREVLAAINPDLILADGYDHCILGVAFHVGIDETVAYDTGCILDTLKKDDGMTEGEAREYFEFNILGSYVGDRTPVFVMKADLCG